MICKKFLVVAFLLFISSFAAFSQDKVQWLSFEEAVERSRTEKKKIFIDVYTDWCGWCKVMDKNTFSDPVIAAYLNENFYPVKFNAEQKEDVSFRGATYSFVSTGTRGYHELAAGLLNNKLSFPTVVFLDEDFRIISPVPGYHKPDFFQKVVTYFGDDHYQETSWKEFEKNYTK